MGILGTIGNLELKEMILPYMKTSWVRQITHFSMSARWLPDWLQSVDVQWRWERSGCMFKHHELSEEFLKVRKDIIGMYSFCMQNHLILHPHLWRIVDVELIGI